MQKILHFRYDILQKTSIHMKQYAHPTSKCTADALYHFVIDVEKALENKQVVLGLFVDI